MKRRIRKQEKQKGKKCVLSYDHVEGPPNVTRVTCKPPECEPVYKKDCTSVTPTCMLVTRVKFVRGAFEPQDKPQCICAIPGSDKDCVYATEVDNVDKSKLKSAKCKGDCPTYYRDKEHKKKIDASCWLVMDHGDANRIKCVCMIPPPQ